MIRRMRIVRIVFALLAVSTAVSAQPFGQYLRLQGAPQHGYIEVPDDTILDTPAMTVEAWVSVHDANNGACSSIAGKQWTAAWWIGLCGTTMRSYFNGTASLRDGGTIPADVWVHIAAVTDGTTRKHYINGNLVFQGAESPRSTSTAAFRIGSDVAYSFTPEGGIDDLRIWTVARTQDQIRATMTAPYAPEGSDFTGQFEGLEAWYRFEGNAMDSWRTHHGTIIGTGIGFATAAGFTPPPARHRAAKH
jgi:concanavalin A-like lectin/glucanase superfamily protein